MEYDAIHKQVSRAHELKLKIWLCLPIVGCARARSAFFTKLYNLELTLRRIVNVKSLFWLHVSNDTYSKTKLVLFFIHSVYSLMQHASDQSDSADLDTTAVQKNESCKPWGYQAIKKTAHCLILSNDSHNRPSQQQRCLRAYSKKAAASHFPFLTSSDTYEGEGVMQFGRA